MNAPNQQKAISEHNAKQASIERSLEKLRPNYLELAKRQNELINSRLTFLLTPIKGSVNLFRIETVNTGGSSTQKTIVAMEYLIKLAGVMEYVVPPIISKLLNLLKSFVVPAMFANAKTSEMNYGSAQKLYNDLQASQQLAVQSAASLVINYHRQKIAPLLDNYAALIKQVASDQRMKTDMRIYIKNEYERRYIRLKGELDPGRVH